MKRNLYKKYKKQSKLKENEKNGIEKHGILKTILSFSSDVISKIIKNWNDIDKKIIYLRFFKELTQVLE